MVAKTLLEKNTNLQQLTSDQAYQLADSEDQNTELQRIKMQLTQEIEAKQNTYEDAGADLEKELGFITSEKNEMEMKLYSVEQTNSVLLDELNKKEKKYRNHEFATSKQTKQFEARIANLEQELEKVHSDFIKLDQILNQREETITQVNMEKAQVILQLQTCKGEILE